MVFRGPSVLLFWGENKNYVWNISSFSAGTKKKNSSNNKSVYKNHLKIATDLKHNFAGVVLLMPLKLFKLEISVEIQSYLPYGQYNPSLLLSEG